jgi:hypothetical protein
LVFGTGRRLVFGFVVVNAILLLDHLPNSIIVKFAPCFPKIPNFANGVQVNQAVPMENTLSGAQSTRNDEEQTRHMKRAKLLELNSSNPAKKGT